MGRIFIEDHDLYTMVNDIVNTIIQSHITSTENDTKTISMVSHDPHLTTEYRKMMNKDILWLDDTVESYLKFSLE